MFAEPTVNDHINQVRLALSAGRDRLAREITRIKTEATNARSFGGSRMYVYIADALTNEFDITVREAFGELQRSVRLFKTKDHRTLRDLTVQELELFAREQTSAARELCLRPQSYAEQTSAEAVVMPKAELLEQRLSAMLRQFDVGLLDKAEQETVSVTNNHMNVGTNIGAIQQGSHGSTQHVEIALDAIVIGAALDVFESELADARLPAEAREVLVADVATVRAQIKKPSLNKTILGEVGSSIRNVIEGVAATVITPQMIAAATAFSDRAGRIIASHSTSPHTPSLDLVAVTKLC